MQTVSCPYCRGRMDANPKLAGQEVSCPYCQQIITMPVIHPPTAIIPPVASVGAPKKMIRSPNPIPPWSAILLSLLIVGLPQIVMGQVAKGIAMLLCAFVIGALTGCIACVIIWPLAAIDAYMIAARMERREPIGEWDFFGS